MLKLLLHIFLFSVVFISELGLANAIEISIDGTDNFNVQSDNTYSHSPEADDESSINIQRKLNNIKFIKKTKLKEPNYSNFISMDYLNFSRSNPAFINYQKNLIFSKNSYISLMGIIKNMN